MHKNTSIQIIRCLSLFMIISCHILQGLDNKWALWINVGVQIFFFVSGFLYGGKEITEESKFYLGRLKKVLYPLSVLTIIIYFVERIFLSNSYSKIYILGNILGFGGFNGTFKTITNTWFVSYILLCYLITPILQHVFRKENFKNNFFLLIIICIILHLFCTYEVVNFIIPWIVCYILGYFYSKCCKTKNQKKIFTNSCLILTALILPVAIIYQENINITLLSIFNEHSEVIIEYGHVFLGITLFLLLNKLLSSLKVKENIIINYIDKYSYHIYLVHQIFILNNFSLLNITNNLIINILIIFCTSIICGIVLYHFCEIILKVISKFIRAITKLKNKENSNSLRLVG